MSDIVIYETEDKQTRVEVRIEADTTWLSLNQIATLFDRDKSVISRHLSKIFSEEELGKHAVVAKKATTAADGKVYIVEFYNLDAIISVGYRVNSRRGTQFRQWATRRLRDYLVEGYAINERRLAEKDLELKQLKDGIGILRRAIAVEARSLDDAEALASLLERFASGLTLLDDYDHETLDAVGKARRPALRVDLAEYRAIIERLKGEFASGPFAQEKDQGFESAVGQIYQSFGGSELYPTLEEKAATLLYLVVKNHAFVDGNKRIGAACFLYFLERNGMLRNKDGIEFLDNDALAALTLFVAVSRPEEEQTVKKVIISILSRKDRDA